MSLRPPTHLLSSPLFISPLLFLASLFSSFSPLAYTPLKSQLTQPHHHSLFSSYLSCFNNSSDFSTKMINQQQCVDHLTDSCVALCNPEIIEVSDPNHTSDTKNDSPCKPEKTHEPDLPKDVKREASPAVECTVSNKKESAEECTRERLKKHRQEMAGRVWIPDMWGQEGFLKDWKDCNVFDRSLVPKGLISARDALVEECRRTANSKRPIRIQKSC